MAHDRAGSRPPEGDVRGHLIGRAGTLAGVLGAGAVAVVALAGGPSRAAWPYPNHDLAGSRAGDSAIDASDVGNLRVAWRFVFPEETTFSGLDASTPLVVGGVVYVQTLRSNVYALDLATGRLLWRRVFARVDGGPNGLASDGRALYGSTDTSVFALDRRTGSELWSRRITRPAQPIDIAPVVSDGVVVTSTTGLPPGGKGTLYGLDAHDGAVRWRFVTIKGDWAVPGEAGGGGAWWPGSVGRGGMLYVGNSNPLPVGGSRRHPDGGAYAGRALYTESLLALDLRTGRLSWFDQVVPHDVRDYDFAVSPIVAHGVVYGAGKNGRVYAWDERTHRRLWTTPVGVHRNDTGPLPRHAVRVCPGLFGGVETPMALAGRRLFVPVVDLCFAGSAYGFPSFDTTDPATGRGELTALDAETGARLWSRKLPSAALGCATVSNDVVFTATLAGWVYAFAAADGHPLWRAREPAGVNACPAVAGRSLVVGAGAEPTGIRLPVPQVTAYRLP